MAEDSGAYINPFHSLMGKSLSQQGHFSPHVRIPCISEKIKRVYDSGEQNRLKLVWGFLSAPPSPLLPVTFSVMTTPRRILTFGQKLLFYCS